MTLAAGALSGLPPLSGFFSKEAIMGALAARSNPIWLGAGLLGAFLTAYYSFRLIFVLLFAGRDPAEEGGSEADQHAGHGTAPAWHDRVMNGPLLILAAVTLVLGFMEHPLERFLSSVYPEGAPVVHHLAWLPWTAIGLCLAGLLLAWVEFGRPRAPRIGFVERVPALHNLFAERWYIDRFYRWFLDLVIYRLVAGTCEANDRKVIDGGLDGLGQGVQGSGRKVDGLNRVVIQQRLGVMFAVIFFLALYVFF
jgi:NADH-quinone oxidoreductase subunit L